MKLKDCVNMWFISEALIFAGAAPRYSTIGKHLVYFLVYLYVDHFTARGSRCTEHEVAYEFEVWLTYQALCSGYHDRH